MKSTLLIFLTVFSLMFGGCALVSPFKSINSCKDVKNGGANCASVESNLEYSIENDKSKGVISKEKKEDNSTSSMAVPSGVHSDKDVERSELVRLMAAMNIGANSREPVLVPPVSYKVVILPYSDGKKFYSGRNIYIVAGKPRWIAGNFNMSGAKYKIQNGNEIEIPALKGNPVYEKEPQISDEKVTRNFSENEEEQVTKAKSNSANVTSPVIEIRKLPSIRHRVSSYYLNCRDLPNITGNSIAVFEKDDILDITDKSSKWWQVRYNEVECYINSSYVYSEPEL